jgi:HlyD family secretion protein
MRKVLFLLIPLLLVAGAGGYWYWIVQPGNRTQFRTAPVERRFFQAFISASGPLEPVDSIDVGAQVAGRIERFGLDPRYQSLIHGDVLQSLFSPPGALLAGCVPVRTIDYGSPVEKGTILAQIDDELYRNDVDLAISDVDKAMAEFQELVNKQVQLEQDWQRAKELNLRKAISPAEYDAARSAFITNQDRINVSRAVLKRAEVLLAKAEINLGYTTIRSPVKGIIVDRRVNVGQTVVASLTAPSLFLISTDLRRLQIWASVNEADIGQIQPGQKVLFTVDAFPRDEFEGYVAEDQPRLNASMTQNVVTYTVVANVENPDLKLRPYMTANVRFVLDERSDALVIANAALRWQPTLNQVVPDFREEFQKKSKTRPSLQDAAESQERTVWVEDGNFVRPIRLKIGLSDATNSEVREVLSGDLDEGDLIITGEESRHETNGNNPFTPSIFGGGQTSQ